ncbi:MAG TPA: LL-diaminopimelate aminotransferase [Ktedonobacterales bacterium]|nr:LL-diaminopimelate aminotransferase [Ktedonobacterales bacterium]
MELSRRLQQLPPYHFAAYARKIAEKRAEGVDVISLSMGDPDLPTPPEVLDALDAAARQPINQRYPEYAGMAALREATAAWFVRRFGVDLDPAREILPVIGSKEGLAHLPLAVMDEGDVALMPNPQYPVYPTAVALAGGACYDLPLDAADGWLPDLDAIPTDVAARAKTLWLNYPNNPTGACASRAFFERAVRFAHDHDVLLVHDMAYAEVTFEGARPPSILEIPDARAVAVEFHSLSKAYNMAGFRVGMLVGNATIVEGMTRLKSNIDTGIFRPLQIAAARALELPQSWLDARNAIYQRRRDALVAACRALGMQVEVPQAGLYLWPRIPAGQASTDFALNLLERTGVAVTPGTNFGSGGEGYVRISLTVPDAQLDEAVARMSSVIGAGRA